jgi:hypothetical protein
LSECCPENAGQVILKLRALTANNDFDQYWTYHLTQEHQRNHHTRYQPAA